MFHHEDSRNLKDGEELLQEVRRSLWSFFRHIVLAALFLFGPFFLLFPLLRIGEWGLLLFALLLAVGGVLTLRAIILYRRNVLYITTERLIDVDQRGFFSHVVSETTYDKIQDVSYARTGVWQTVTGIGTVFIQTAGGGANLEAKDVRNPASVHALIMNVQRERAELPSERMSAEELLHLAERLKHGIGSAEFQTLVASDTDRPNQSAQGAAPPKKKRR
ncbi:MAG: PH domain-containing protein [Candidatus Kerfeldbacteria bacterium]|nr:PH domain-containing protein [Candidatus Kerfeldbacteria bacterium]